MVILIGNKPIPIGNPVRKKVKIQVTFIQKRKSVWNSPKVQKTDRMYQSTVRRHCHTTEIKHISHPADECLAKGSTLETDHHADKCLAKDSTLWMARKV